MNGRKEVVKGGSGGGERVRELGEKSEGRWSMEVGVCKREGVEVVN